MSSSPALPGGGSAPPGISDVVSQEDLTRWAQLAGVLQYLTQPVSEPGPPASPIPLPNATAKVDYDNIYAMLRQLGVPAWAAVLWAAFWASVTGVIGLLAGWLGQVAGLVVGPLLGAFLTALDGLRKGIDPDVSILAVGILQELLGTEFTTATINTDTDVAGHIARAGQVGALLTGQLISEFTPANNGVAVPSSAPAERFTGFAINFGIATGILAAVGGMFPVGHLNELRELGEEVARNIGLGRLVRQALMPLVHIMVALPYTWYLNTKYHPTQFNEGMLVNPFSATLLGHDKLYAAMDLLGYSTDKIDAFVKMHQKKFTPAEALLLVDNAIWQRQTAVDYAKTLGFPEELADTALGLEEMKRERGWYEKLISELETDVVRGAITLEEFAQILNGTSATTTVAGTTLPASQGLPFSQAEKDIILATVTYKYAARKRVRPERLSEGELAAAFEAGLITATDLTDYWTARGLPEKDQNIRLLLILLRLSRLETLTAARRQHFQAQQVAYLEKAAGAKHVQIPPVEPIPPYPLS